MTATESKDLEKGARVYWRGDAADSGTITEKSWDAVTIAWDNGHVAIVHHGDMSEILRRRLTITGATLRPRPVEFKASVAQALREKVWPLIEAGKIRPVIYKTFALDEAAAAHSLMESSEHVGKIMLNVRKKN